MAAYCIIETPNGLTIGECPTGSTPEEVAAGLAGTLIDPGPFPSYEDAVDALDAIAAMDDEAEFADS